MLIPSKHEKLDRNILVIGSDILSLLKRKNYNVETLFQDIKRLKSISLDQYYNTITFLWLSDLIDLKQYQLIVKKY